MSNDYGLITLAPGTVPMVTDNPFTTRQPKGDGIKAVKLTEGNLKQVAGYILKTLGAR